MMNEKDIIKRLKSPEWKIQNEGFRLLYDLYFHDLYCFVMQYIRSSESAKEIAHDAFVKLWVHRESLDESRNVKAYLFTISKNSMIKELRRQFKTPLLRDYFEIIVALSTDAKISYDYDAFMAMIDEAKEFLSPRQRQIYQMNKEENICIKDIASELNIKEQVARNQLSTAVRKIKEYISSQVKDKNVINH